MFFKFISFVYSKLFQNGFNIFAVKFYDRIYNLTSQNQGSFDSKKLSNTPKKR